MVLGSVLVARFSSDWWNDGTAGPLHLYLKQTVREFLHGRERIGLESDVPRIASLCARLTSSRQFAEARYLPINFFRCGVAGTAGADKPMRPLP